jgi:hypothetical protein
VSNFGVGVHPDLPITLAHFTGRPRAANDRPPWWAPGTPEGRLAAILHGNAIRYNSAPGTPGYVVCLSEASAPALTTLFLTGVTWRGPYAPWALLLGRQALIDAGARPVWYMSDDELDATAHLPARMRDRRVRYEPGKNSDWLAEREWRLCWGDYPLSSNHYPVHPLTGLLTAVIVGTPGWCPPPLEFGPDVGHQPQLAFATAAHGARRLLWTGAELRDDGLLNIETQAAAYGMRP